MTIETNNLKSKFTAAVLGGAVLLTAGFGMQTTAIAAGESSTTTIPSCKKGFVYNKRKKKCVKLKKSENLSDDNIYLAARDLAYSKRYAEAIEVLKMAKNQNDPRILNYLGYSTRKSGDVEKGLFYYQAAIKIDPDYTLARSYMGEAFLQLNQPEKARTQLAEIAQRCGTTCREYSILEKKIKLHKI